MNKCIKIDFVITWVDSNDNEWKKSFNFYSNKLENNDQNNSIRYRDWGILKYWFRSVELYAPWANKIFFVTNGQVPNWLNINNKKLRFVKHSEYIPDKYLPTFSSHVIENNFHRIKDLSENFVYFNDDMFLNDYVGPKDFFVNGLPCFCYREIPQMSKSPDWDFYHILYNNINLINKHINKKDFIRHNFKKIINPKYGIKTCLQNFYLMFYKQAFLGFGLYHNANPHLKSSFKKIWDLEPAFMDRVSRNKFRTLYDVNQYVFNYWCLTNGQFYPKSINNKYFSINKNNVIDCAKNILNSTNKLLCINDDYNCDDFEYCSSIVQNAFEKKFPHQSSYEK